MESSKAVETEAGASDGDYKPGEIFSVDDDGEPLYIVEAVRQKKYVRGKPMYLIKWFGWPEKSNTWEPLENVDGEDVKEMIRKCDEEEIAKSIIIPKLAYMEFIYF